MPFNGTGTYAAPSSSWNPATPGVTIDPTAWNTLLADVSTALSSALLKDGTQAATALIPFANGISTDTISEFSTGGGVTIDGVLLKDNAVTASGGVNTSVVNGGQGADIASASTINLTTATGNVVDVTGTTTVTAITLAQGYWRVVRFTGILTLTNGASLVLPTGSNITTAAGDYALFAGYASSVVRCVMYQRKDGTALVGASPASETVAGIIEIATAAETTTGTDDTRAITPLKLTTWAPASATMAPAADSFIMVDASDSNKLKQIPLPAGFCVQRSYAEYTTSADLTTAIPYDDSIPQNGEGTQVLTASITPLKTTNRVRARVMGFGAGNVSVVTMSVALFRNSVADALRASGERATQTDAANPLMLEFEDSPGSTSAQTYNVRVGPDAGTMRLNGTSTARRFGGVAAMTLVLEEFSS